MFGGNSRRDGRKADTSALSASEWLYEPFAVCPLLVAVVAGCRLAAGYGSRVHHHDKRCGNSHQVLQPGAHCLSRKAAELPTPRPYAVRASSYSSSSWASKSSLGRSVPLDTRALRENCAGAVSVLGSVEGRRGMKLNDCPRGWDVSVDHGDPRQPRNRVRCWRHDWLQLYARPAASSRASSSFLFLSPETPHPIPLQSQSGFSISATFAGQRFFFR